jgi:hypothetical protein
MHVTSRKLGWLVPSALLLLLALAGLPRIAVAQIGET